MKAAALQIGYWIIPVITGIISAFIGYKLGKSNSATALFRNELEEVSKKNIRLEAELAQCRKKHAGSGSRMVLQNIPHFDPASARMAFGRNIVENDLKLIEGIGPKIEGLFHNYDIKSWQALAETPVAKCREVLSSGGDRFQVHDPSSWPMQARMACEGKWKSLAKWQEEHKRGKL